MNHFRPIDRDTGFLMPPLVDEWLPEQHLARFVVEGVAGLELRAMTGRYRGLAEAPYHPRLLLGILVYGYATAVFLSRKLEGATYGSMVFRYVAANEHPDHDTIAVFRRRFLPQTEAQLKAEVADQVARAEAADQADTPDGMLISDELARREERLARIAQARATIEARAKERHARAGRA